MAPIKTAAEAGMSVVPSEYLKEGLAEKSDVVARIAYLSSDVVLSIQPALATDSDFSRHLHSCSASRSLGLVTKGAPEVGFLSTAHKFLRH